MKPSYRFAITVVAMLALSSVGAMAQVDNNINVTASGGATSIQVDITMNIGGTLPTSWVGWVVDRRTNGLCEPEVRLGPVTPFAVGEHTYQFNDPDVLEDVTYYYRVYAVDDQGDRQYLGSPPEFPPAYYHDAYASLGGSGIVARGTMVDQGMGIEVCSGYCWEGIAFVSGTPPELMESAGTGDVVMIYGTIDNEFEGPYISMVTDWFFVGECGTVPAMETSWGGLKARYR